MPEAELTADTTLLSNNFFLEIDGTPMSMLTGVSGLELKVEVTNTPQVMKDGKVITNRIPGNQDSCGTLNLTRLAPADAGADGLWSWFKEIYDKGALSASQKNGSVVMYSPDGKEISRFNFQKAFISKISLSGLDVKSAEPATETIDLEFNLLERVK